MVQWDQSVRFSTLIINEWSKNYMTQVERRIQTETAAKGLSD